MRRFNLTAATLVSTALLMTTTSVFAVGTAKVDLGLLKPQSSWKVGTVASGAENYCAMVGNYDRNVVVAFAQNPDGLGSVAVDFGQDVFTPGQQYDVSLSADSGTPQMLKGRASSAHSLVVQIGPQSGIYDGLSHDGVMSVQTKVAAVKVAVPKFAASRKDLVECAGQMKTTTAAADKAPDQSAAMAPIDRELQQLGQARDKLADASAEADKLQKKIDTKTSSFDALEAQLEAEARAETERSNAKLASIDAQQDKIRTQIKQKGGADDAFALSAVEPAAGQNAAKKPVEGERLSLDQMDAESAKAPAGGRKLLASLGAKEEAPVPLSTGSSARDIEAQQLGLADSKRAAAETEQALQLKDQIAALEAQKNQEAQAKLAAFDDSQKKLDDQAKKLAQKSDESMQKLAEVQAAAPKADIKWDDAKAPAAPAVPAAVAAADTRKLRADVVAQQAKLAEVQTAKAEETKSLTRDLAATQTDFAAKLAALQSERDALKAENDRLKQSVAQGTTADKLEIAQLKKQMMEMDTQRQAELSRSAAAQKELDAARTQIASLRESSQAEQDRLSQLRQSLETERAQLASQRAAGDQAVNEKIAGIKADLDRKTAENDQLKGELQKAAGEQFTVADAQLDKAKADVAAMKADLEKKQSELDAKMASLSSENQQLKSQLAQSSDQQFKVADAALDRAHAAASEKLAELEKQKAALDAKQAELAAREEALNTKSAATTADAAPVSLLPGKDASGKTLTPGQAILASSQSMVASERAELDGLRGRIQSLEGELEKSRAETAAAKTALAAAPAAASPDKAEVARLQSENASLRDQIARKPAETVASADTGEVSRLKSENESLRQKLASFLGGKKDETVASSEEPKAAAPSQSEKMAPAKLSAATPVAAPVVVAAATSVGKQPVAVIANTDTGVAKVKTAAEMSAAALNAEELNATAPAAGGDEPAAPESVTASVKSDAVKMPEAKAEPEVKTADVKTAAAEKPQAVVAPAAPVAPAAVADATPVVDTTPGNDKHMPAVPAQKVTAENMPAPVVSKTVVTKTAVATPAGAVPETDAEAEIARLAPITASIPAASAAQPVAKQETAQDKGVFGIFGRAMGYSAASKRAAAQPVMPEAAPAADVASMQPIIKVERPTAQPAEPTPQVMAATQAANVIPAAEANRAEAFLDNIMAYHRPGVAAPADTSHLAAIAAAPAQPAAAPVVAQVQQLNDITPAAGPGTMAAPVAVPMAATMAAAPRVAPVQPAMPAAASEIDLASLLRQSGVGAVQVSGSGDSRQWTTGAINGMYERTASGGQHKQQVQAYLNRYRDDCPGKLQVNLGQPQKVAAGMLSVANIACTASGNAYATSLVFFDTPSGFQTVLHAGQPQDAAQVRQFASNIASALRPVTALRVDGAAPQVVPVSYAQQPAAAVNPVERPRFRIEIQAPSAPPANYDLPTTIIE